MRTSQSSTPTSAASGAAVYRGRFAPSPTGPLHLGSLATAVASYLQAKRHNGEWLVRIEDIDTQREIPGASRDILQTLDVHGFIYPAPIYQHTRLPAYAAIITDLLAAGAAYRCRCTRQIIEATAQPGRAGLIYPGTCRSLNIDSANPGAVRVITAPDELTFCDNLQGLQRCSLGAEIGDFLIRRGDGLIAYQLAVVVDDAWQGITEVVRGIDLLDATFMQIYLQRLLGYDQPEYLHIPLIIDAHGQKLSKQTAATPIDCRKPVKNLYQVLVLLGQKPEKSLAKATLGTVWGWATEHWNPAALAGLQQVTLTGV